MFSEPEAAHLTMQVLDGVNYLHQKGIVHRDLKLENILLDESQPCMRVKIADFGLSKVQHSSSPVALQHGVTLRAHSPLLSQSLLVGTSKALWHVTCATRGQL